jgi:UrcA family protein
MKISTIIATAAFAMLAGVASAEPASEAAHVKVGYADLNLTTVAGQDVLAKRIDIAARKVCNVDPNERQLPISVATERCYNDAVAKTNFAIASATAPVLASR